MRSIGTTAAMTAMLIAVCFVFSAAAQQGKTYTHSDGGIQFTVPANWKAEADGDLLTLESPDGTVGMSFWVVDSKSIEAASKALDTELDKMLTDVKMDEGSNIKINGLDAFAVDGTAKMDGTPVDFGVMLVLSKKMKVVMILGVGESSELKKHERDMGALMNSIKPAE